jgi:hypothetical protein
MKEMIILGKTQAVPFNIVGQILSATDMPVLNFKVEYPPNYSGVKAVYGVIINYINKLLMVH